MKDEDEKGEKAETVWKASFAKLMRKREPS
jgi:hypothetical protein